jgi:hypothetical protein
VIISDRTPWHSLTGAGWDIPLEEPGKFREAIEYCLAMDQEEYDRYSQKAYEYGIHIAEDQEVLEKNRRLFLD